MKLSVIIVNYNVEYFLEQCLQSVQKAILLFEKSYGNDSAEVFVVDNNSVDGSCAMVLEKFPGVKLIANKENTGFSKANNQAARIASGDYILLLNPDTVVEDDTFTKVTAFMDTHPEAGGLGVKMIDGKGHFLPESKRGLPTPWVAFYKMFGLSALFPRSRKFGRYHLGYLSKDETNEVEILSGAFMLMRKAALDKVGLLDEDYFMYGEDIDLSYRIIKGGYKNYYFAGTRIIHYKGESTKKSSVNYVFIFYRAMVIFAKKHFNQRHAKVFSLLINMAIYLRASIAIFNRFAKKAALPLLDAAVLFMSMFLLKEYWEQNHKYVEGGSYPAEFLLIAVPAYIVAWLGAVYFSGGYDKPYRTGSILRGMLIGTMVILVVYALLPEAYRFSRAIILIGAAVSAMLLLLTRLATHFAVHKNFSFESGTRKRIVIVGSQSECIRVESLLRSTHQHPDITGYVMTEDAADHPGWLGPLRQLHEIVSIYNVGEIIFCAKDISSTGIMDQMSRLTNPNLEYKIAPPESEFIIGSNSINRMGELYVVDLNAISKTSNRRKKRILDVLLSSGFLLCSPLLLLAVRRPAGLYGNIFRVISGKYSWVSYGGTTAASQHLPKIKPGILAPSDTVDLTIDEPTLQKLNMLYAKDYSTYTDLVLVLKAFRKLGN